MRTLGKNIFVAFDLAHNKEFDVGGTTLIRPDGWASDLNEGKTESNVNHLETNPQVAIMLADNPTYGLNKGDKVFLHYMAFEWAEAIQMDGMNGWVVPDADYVFFKIVDDKFVMVNDTYIGQRIYKDNKDERTGLYLTSQAEVAVESNIELTHIPEKQSRERAHLTVGTKVLTVDDNQYIFEYEGKSYVKLSGDEIVGVL